VNYCSEVEFSVSVGFSGILIYWNVEKLGITCPGVQRGLRTAAPPTAMATGGAVS
jgi:hypothetical protein